MTDLDGRKVTTELQSVLQGTNLKYLLIFVSALNRRDLETVFRNGKCAVFPGKKCVLVDTC